MFGRTWVGVALTILLIGGCSGPQETRAGKPTLDSSRIATGSRIQTSTGPSVHATQEFTVLLRVISKPPVDKVLGGAVVRLPGIDQEWVADQNGVAGPLSVALPNTERFPYEIEVSKVGFKTCVIEFGSMVFPDSERWWESRPYRLFVYLPEGEGVVGGDECYGGRTQPQTPGN